MSGVPIVSLWRSRCPDTIIRERRGDVVYPARPDLALSVVSATDPCYIFESGSRPMVDSHVELQRDIVNVEPPQSGILARTSILAWVIGDSLHFSMYNAAQY